MMLHYEHVVGRSNGREWRVADENDDYRADFLTEAEAQAHVVRHNNEHRARYPTWKYE